MREAQSVPEFAHFGEEVDFESPLRLRLPDGDTLQPLQPCGQLLVSPALDDGVHAGLGGKEGARRGA